MADVKITDLPEASVNVATNYMVVDTGAATQKILVQNFYTGNTINGWTQISSFGSGWSATTDVYYLKDPLGVVFLMGSCYAASPGSATIFSLPSGYWPAQTLRFLNAQTTAWDDAYLTISHTDGAVAIAGIGVSEWKAFFDGIIFRAA